MSVYFKKGKGWRYDFTLDGTRYTQAWFKTKRAATTAENERRGAIKNPKPVEETATQTGMAFLELVNKRLDHVKAYNSESHYETSFYTAKGWVKRWGGYFCCQVTGQMVRDFLLERSNVSAYTANRELRYLRATFNFGKKRKFISNDPTVGIEFLPVERKVKYIPPLGDIEKVLNAADNETRQYLTTISDTMGRISEINRLTWDDVDLENGFIILYTRKKKGGHLTPRKVPLTNRLAKILGERSKTKEADFPWVFYASYIDRKTKKKVVSPFKQYRGTILKTLCRKVGVRPFTFHTLRHAGASIMDNNNVPIAAIQRILGHENRTTTEIYLHTMRDAERVAIAVYEDAVKNSHTVSHTAG